MSSQPPSSSTEVWQRGPVPGVDPLLMPVAHALLQVQEDLRALAARVADEEHVWQRPGGAASIAFHVRHIGGSTERLLTYARAETLSEAPRAAAKAESIDDQPRATLQQLVEETIRALDGALAQVRATPRDALLEARTVGRLRLPSTTIGLLFHAAEHATRHAGQALTTASILSGK
jgi:uncharacterized damage-inducible protein DinB